MKKLNADFNRISKKIKDGSRTGIKKNISNVLVTGANDTRNDIIKSMRNTPRQKPKWINWPNEKKQKSRHFPSKPGHPPAIDTGDLIKSIQFDAYDYKFIIGSIQTDPPYPEWLEKGTKKMKARPWLEPASERQEPIIIRNLGKIIPDLTNEIFRRRT